MAGSGDDLFRQFAELNRAAQRAFDAREAARAAGDLEALDKAEDELTDAETAFVDFTTMQVEALVERYGEVRMSEETYRSHEERRVFERTGLEATSLDPTPLDRSEDRGLERSARCRRARTVPVALARPGVVGRVAVTSGTVAEQRRRR